MRFAWNRATAEETTADQPAPAATTAATSAIGGVELLTVDGRRVGWVDTGGQRTSDWLNAHDDVPIRGLVAGDEAEVPTEPPHGPGAETTIARGDIVWVLPPPLPPNRHLRLHRRRLLVHLELDDYDVSGQVHVRPGADPVDQVLRGTRDLVPLTEVQVVTRADRSHGMVVPVLIVNRIHVRRVVEDLAHQSAAVPEPVEAPAPDAAELDPRIALLVPEQPAAPAANDSPPAHVEEPPSPATEEPVEGSGVALLRSALELLLEAGIIDVVEFQSIRARIPSVPTD